MKKGSGRVQPRNPPNDGSWNADASKTTKRGAAGFGAVFTARKTWASPLAAVAGGGARPTSK
jgi:hypothetical protein